MSIMRKEPSDRVVYRIMAVFISSCWFHFTNLIFLVTKFIEQHVFRIKTKPIPVEERNFNGFGEEEEYTSNFSFKFEYQIPEFNSISKENSCSILDTEGDFSAEKTIISNYKFLSEKDFSGFVVEPEAMTFKVHESFISQDEENTESNFLSSKDYKKFPMESRDDEDLRFNCLSAEDSKDDMVSVLSENELTSEEISESTLSSEKDSNRFFTESKGFMLSRDEPFISRREKILSEKDFKKSFKQLKQVLLPKDEFFVNRSEFRKSSLGSENDVLLKDQNLGEESPVTFEEKSLFGKEIREGFSDFGCDSDSISSSDGYSVKNLVVDSESDGFLSEKDSGDEESLKDSTTTSEVELIEENLNMLHSIRSLSLLDETWSENDSSEMELELKDLNAQENTESPPRSSVLIEFMDSSEDELPLFRKNSSKSTNFELPDHKIVDSEYELDSTNANQLSPTNGLNQVEKKASQEESHVEDLNDDELDELESLWEHQDLIEQLKMEIKKAKGVGLPTILEESESPKMSEDLKPWKIDEKFLREDPIDELHKFYKSYRERMRKFDILNYQKMYAIGFLQLKDPLQSLGSPKPLIPTILSQISQNSWLPYRRKSKTGSPEKFIKELQVELETVYVGQTCLSWEFLRWQFEKSQELPESDLYRSHQYNQVAGEFQQFQVIVQRFIENESFQGPRLPNYVKNRCVLRNLLQVPLIKGDCLKDKMEQKRKGNNAITSEMLEDIMEESIRIFWEFIKAEKDENSVIFKGLIRNQVELQDSSDYNLLADVQASLQKKEKRLKDILKTGNCLVKKFKKPQEDRSNQDLFFSQVDMKLVSRVLKMSRITTDQLVWCHMKLNKIKVADRKIHREPAFLLFPC